MIKQQDIEEMEEEIKRCGDENCHTCRELREIIVHKHNKENKWE